MGIILNWCTDYSKTGHALIRDMHSPEISTQKNGEILKDVRFEMTRTSTPMASLSLKFPEDSAMAPQLRSAHFFNLSSCVLVRTFLP